MAHKGYTLVNLINFFSNTTNAQWKNSGVAAVAGTPGREAALASFLGTPTSIAAGTGSYARLGATPRGRILRALRNRKRTGSVLN
jgi:hypothetical protein